MGVALGRRAVGGPARVADAGEARERFLLQKLDELDELAGAAAALDVAVDKRGDARRVIAAIFEPLQRLDDQRRNLARSRNTDDAAHR